MTFSMLGTLAWLPPAQSAYLLGGSATIPTNIDLTQIIQYGVLGVILVLILFGRLVPGGVYDRRVEELKLLQERYDRLEDIVNERVIPALVRSTDALTHRDPGGGPGLGDSFR